VKKVWAFFKGFRTLLINGGLALAAGLLVVSDQFSGLNWLPFVGAKWAPIAVIAVNCLNIWLRYITTTPVGKK
jgi:hypothetical protein